MNQNTIYIYDINTLMLQMHLKYPLYGTGSSAITYYSETIKKTGPVSYKFEQYLSTSRINIFLVSS